MLATVQLRKVKVEDIGATALHLQKCQWMTAAKVADNLGMEENTVYWALREAVLRGYARMKTSDGPHFVTRFAALDGEPEIAVRTPMCSKIFRAIQSEHLMSTAQLADRLQAREECVRRAVNRMCKEGVLTSPLTLEVPYGKRQFFCAAHRTAHRTPVNKEPQCA